MMDWDDIRGDDLGEKLEKKGYAFLETQLRMLGLEADRNPLGHFPTT